MKSLIFVAWSDQKNRTTLTLVHQPHHIETPPSPRSNEMRELLDHINQKCILLQCLGRFRSVQVINIFDGINQLPLHSKLLHVQSRGNYLHPARACPFFPYAVRRRKLDVATRGKDWRKTVGRVTDLADSDRTIL